VAGEGFKVDHVSFIQQFPGLRLLSAIRLAFDLRKVIVAAVGLAVLEAGWSVLDWLLPAAADVTPGLFWTLEIGRASSREFVWLQSAGAFLPQRLLEPFLLVISPLRALLNPVSEWGWTLHGFLGLLWLMLVWGICGGVIARMALVQIAKQQKLGIGEAIRFGLRSATPLCLAPFCPVMGIMFCALLVLPFGVLYRLPVIGPAIAGILLFVPLLLGLVMTMLAAGLVAGWPFLSASVAAGADDALDALSRTFSYLSQRLGALCILVVPIAIQGIAGLVLVELLAAGVIQLTAWSLGLTAPFDFIVPVFVEGRPAGGTFAWTVHVFWLGVVRLLARGWVYSFTWSAAALLYLWLRNDVDSMPWTEIDLPGASPAGPINQVPTSAIGETAPASSGQLS
jgi:hypothetical protein